MANDTPALTLGVALRRYLDARNAAMVTARASLGITDTDARALLFVVGNPGTRPTALREYLGITSAGVTTLIDRLVSRSLVRREVDPFDRRVNRITATIDIAEDPWSALNRFDDDFDVAVDAADQTRVGDSAALLAALTAATVGARRD
ncbi:MarR family winged helix-turn-helix transcriptional regulator [Microbacterium sp. NPDC056044]|uniref:MarR family winged helix-turn-helix transcriptional regulator n=1 Tax=Microbacterium sp. NPDC056044 TaxID=3345690 RepID=UPI0035D86CC8